MKKEYIIELINLHSDKKSNLDLNHFFFKKVKILSVYFNYKKYFNYFLLSIYFLNLFYFAILFLNNFYYNQKLDYIEGVYCFIAFISILFVFILNDFFNYFFSKYVNKKYTAIKNNHLNNEFNKSLFEDLKLEEPILLSTVIENKLQEVQDESPILLKEVYYNYNFKNEDTRKYVHFLISQEDFEE